MPEARDALPSRDAGRCAYAAPPRCAAARRARPATAVVGIHLITEAMDAVHLGLTWRERVVLIVLAETARDDSRLCWPGYEGSDARAQAFRRRVDCSRTQFYATLSALVSKGALEVVEHGYKGHQAVYRVLPPQSPRVIHSVPETGTLSALEASREPGPINGSKGPGFRDAVDAKGSRFRVQRVPETGTPTPQSPQYYSPSLSLSPPAQDEPREERETDDDDEEFNPAVVELIRAAMARARVPIDDEDVAVLGMWIEDEYHPRGMGWWRKLDKNGDIPDMHRRWRDHLDDVERRSAARTVTLVECPRCARPMRPTPGPPAPCRDCRAEDVVAFFRPGEAER